jgi:nucleoside-diphosphate-sugar epimerase
MRRIRTDREKPHAEGNTMSASLEIPVTATRRESRPAAAGPRPPADRRARVLLTGSAGVVGTVLARHLSNEYELFGLDPRPVPEPGHWAGPVLGSVADRTQAMSLAAGMDFVLHLATGVSQGWAGLSQVDIEGTRNVLDGALSGGCRRVLICSSNHVVGWTELDYLSGLDVDLPVGPLSLPRPDGLYGAAKAAGEALGRAAAEFAGLPVTILRIGTVRLDDRIDAALDEPGFAYIGDRAAVRDRLRRTWLYHRDLVQIIRAEFAAPETFRLRYATSFPDNRLWSHQPFTWSGPSAGTPAPATPVATA